MCLSRCVTTWAVRPNRMSEINRRIEGTSIFWCVTSPAVSLGWCQCLLWWRAACTRWVASLLVLRCHHCVSRPNVHSHVERRTIFERMAHIVFWHVIWLNGCWNWTKPFGSTWVLNGYFSSRHSELQRILTRHTWYGGKPLKLFLPCKSDFLS